MKDTTVTLRDRLRIQRLLEELNDAATELFVVVFAHVAWDFLID